MFAHLRTAGARPAAALVARAVGALALAVAGCSTPPPAQSPQVPQVTALACQPGDLSPEAFRKAGLDPSGNTAILNNGRAITPAGTRFATADFPLGIAVNADETRAYVTHNGDGRSLMVLDLAAAPASYEAGQAPAEALLQTVALGSSFRGVALTPDGKTLVVGGGGGAQAWFFDVKDDGTLAVPGTPVPLAGYISDLALSPDGATAYVVAATNSKVYELDVATRALRRQFPTGGAYTYDLEVGRNGALLWASNMTANTVTAVDLSTGQMVARIPVGKGPEAMAQSRDGSRLYVASSDDDSVAVIDTATRTLVATWNLSDDPDGLKHGNVNGLAVSGDGSRLLVTAAALNRVDIVDTATGTVLGAVPTGWYPTEVRLGGKALYVASSKGMGNPNSLALKTIPGFLAAIPWPDPATLATMTAQVQANNRRGDSYYASACKPEDLAVLKGPPDSPIKHVLMIVRENKTYDMVLGDQTDKDGNPIGDGDPELVVFGEKNTPNFHKISREFSSFDNFYSNPEVSLQGHQWVTQSQCNDLMEKQHEDQVPIPGIDEGLIPGGPFPTVFDLMYGNGVSWRNYGEFPSFGLRMLDVFRDFYDHKYPYWTQGVWDVDKAAEAIREWELGIFPTFIFMGLPNDHTYGSKSGFPTPQTMVADNDRGTGLLIDWITHSEYWPETVVFILEDDPQGTGDHVEAHRSLLTVVSPWVRREYISSVHYDIPSIFRTIEMILGLPPMGKNDAYAPPIVDIWKDGVVDVPDETPYDDVPVDIPYAVNGADARMAAESDACDWDEVDECPGLGRILWRVVKGDVEPPPYARGIDR